MKTKRYPIKLLIIVFISILLCSCRHSDSISKDNPPNHHDNKEVFVYEELVTGSPHNQHDQGLPESVNPFIDVPPNPFGGVASADGNPVVINGRSFSAEEINAGIRDTFNSLMYLYGGVVNGWLENDELLHKDIEYELFFDPYYNDGEDQFLFPKKVYMVITNMFHPSSIDGDPLLFMFGIDITEWGLRSDLYYAGDIPEKKQIVMYDNEPIHLGSYSMRIDEIIKPQFEIMDAAWIENTKNEIRMYMDVNDFYGGEPGYDLAPGSYHVNVQKFFRSDDNSIIIFEHENGSVYAGYYYYVHENSGNYPALLNHVELVCNPNTESFQTYLDKVRSDPAVSLEYSVK